MSGLVKFILLAVSLASIPSAVSADQVVSFYKSHCVLKPQLESNTTYTNRIYNRGKLIGYNIDFGSFMNIINHGSVSFLVQQVAYITGPIITWVILLIFIIIIFGLFLYRCDRLTTTNQKCANACFVLSSVFCTLIIFSTIAILVTAITTGNSLKDSKCEMARFYIMFVSGLNYTSSSFQGFASLQGILTDLNTALPSFPALLGNYQQMYNSNLESLALPALQSLLVFTNMYSGRKTSNGFGHSKVPNTIANLTYGVNQDLHAEFSRFQVAANRLTSGAAVGIRLSLNETYRMFFSQAIKDLKSQVAVMQNVLSDKMSSDVNKAINGLGAGSSLIYVCLCFTFIGLVMAVLCLVFLWYQNENKVDRCRNGVKVMLLVTMGITIFLSGILVFYALFAVTVTSGCRAIPQVLDSPDIIGLFYRWGISFNSTMTKIAQNCLSLGGTGNLDYMFQDRYGQFNNMWFYLDAVSLFLSAQKNIHASLPSESAIQRLVLTWQSYAKVIRLDHSSASLALEEFNNYTSCTGISYVFNNANCTGKTNCAGVVQQEGYLPSSCVADASMATFLFNNLKAFVEEESDLLTRMVEDLAGYAPTTPLSLITHTKQAFTLVMPEFQPILDNTGAFLRYLPIGGGFTANMNCSTLRVTALSIEEQVCFKANNILVGFVIILGFTVFAMFGFSLTLFITMICMERLVEDLKIHQDTARSFSKLNILDPENSCFPDDK